MLIISAFSDDANDYEIASEVRFVAEPGGKTILHNVAADAIRFVSNDAEAPLYVHADHLGASQRMSDQAGAPAWDRVQKPFGETVSLTGAATNPQRFPGQLNDPETGFHYNYFRDYDPSIGRYLQSDPFGLAGGLNTYGYVGGNPVNYYDPDGKLAAAIIPLVIYGVPIVATAICLTSPDLCRVPDIDQFLNWIGNVCPLPSDWYDRPLLNESSDDSNGDQSSRPTKEPKPNISGEEGAKDVPSWARGERPLVGEKGRDFADRLLDRKYGRGNYRKGPKSEHGKIKKWGDRAFK